jgi:hypothetical protein
MSQSILHRRRFIAGAAASTASLLLPWHTRIANAAPLPPGSPWQLPDNGVSINSVTMMPNLANWLSLHPNVRDAIVWETSNGAAVPYAFWGNGIGTLNAAFANAYHGVPTGLPKVPTNIGAPFSVISTSDAWPLYIAHVAHSLAVELRGDLPWSITTMSTAELRVLFDSRQYFAWDSTFGGYRFAYKSGTYYTASDCTLAPPDYVYGFLQANAIPNPTHMAAGQINPRVLYSAKAQAFAKLLSWCSDKMSHFLGSYDTAGQLAHWQYAGCAPVSRIIEGTINVAVSPLLHHWTAGCHGTTGFLRAVARTMNIAVDVRYLPPFGHTAPYLPALDVWLSHGDDPYAAGPSTALVGAALSFPATELLVSSATMSAWSDPALSDDQKEANVGRRQVELWVKYLPINLLGAYLLDQFQNKSHSDGNVAASLSNVYTLPELEAMNLWQQMDTKIQTLGGAWAVHQIFDKAEQEKHT